MSYLSRHPEGTSRTLPRDLRRGMVVALDKRLWSVLDVICDDEHEARGPERPWRLIVRPFGLSLDWTAMDDDCHFACGHWARIDTYVHPQHFPVCRECGGPWPCHHLRAEQQADRDIARADRYSIPGVCPACREPVSQRQLRQTWAVNLYALDRDQPVTFHLRNKCIREAVAYDEAIRKAGHPSQLGYQPKETR